jgi:hypothetical protein
MVSYLASECDAKGWGLQGQLWMMCAGAVSVAGLAVWRDRVRTKRRNLDAVGWVPWPLVLILSIIVAAVLAAFALQVR